MSKTRDEQLALLREMGKAGEGEGLEEENHLAADAILLELIGDEEISLAFLAIKKWYA